MTSAPLRPRLDGLRVLMLSWRDTRNPEGGGAELYLERVAKGLVDRGAHVTLFAAAAPGLPEHEVRDGIHFVRRGTKLTVYLRGLEGLLRRRFGRVDVVIDVQNGMPFLSALVTRRPVVVLVHHVHREQWPVVYPGVKGRIGWWIESRLSPRLYRRSRYVAVSNATARELAELGVDPQRVTVVRNGNDSGPASTHPKTPYPSICTVSRLVPHKQIEHAIDAAIELRAQHPGLRLVVAGSGWWETELHEYAARRGAGDTVVFTGHVDQERRDQVYAEAWVMALPSLKEGWGLVVLEAGSQGTPTVAYASAGGTRESISDGVSGLLVDTPAQLVHALDRVLRDADLRERLSAGARHLGVQSTWDATQEAFAEVVGSAGGRAADAGLPVGD